PHPGGLRPGLRRGGDHGPTARPHTERAVLCGPASLLGGYEYPLGQDLHRLLATHAGAGASEPKTVPRRTQICVLRGVSLFSVLGLLAKIPPNRPSGRRRFCAANSEPPRAAENCAGAALPTPSI